MDLRERARQLKTDIPAVFLCMKDKNTPAVAKILAGVTVAYALSPVDLIPDFIPVLGYLDDVILLPFLISLTIRSIPQELFEHHREEAKGLWASGRPKKWYYALPIAAIWLLVLWLILRAFLF